jgi:hypothetical protein
MKKITLLDIILLLIAILFVYAAVSKLITYDEFKVQISKSPLITNQGWWISWAVPAAELIVAALLFVPRFQVFALYGAFFIMFVFTIYIGFMIAFTPNLPCSCGGILSKMGWTEHLIFNIVFTIIPVVGIYLSNRQQKSAGEFVQQYA